MGLTVFGVEIPTNEDSLNINGVDIDTLHVFGVLVWEKQKFYWIVFSAHGGAGSMANQTLRVGVAEVLDANAFARTGYLFDGWSKNGSSRDYTDGQQVRDIAAAGATLTLYALWRAITYYVDYNGSGATGGGTARSQHTYDAEKALTANGFVKTGYLFTSWHDAAGTEYVNGQHVRNLTASDGAVIILYADWTPIVYYVSYNGNGATGGSTALSRHTYDADGALTVNGFSRDYFIFCGWSDDGGSAVRYGNGQSVRNLAATDGAVVNLSAVWRPTTVVNGKDACTPVTGGISRGTSGGEFADNAWWEAWGGYGWGAVTTETIPWICTKNQIDLTNVSKIHFKFDISYHNNLFAGVTKQYGLNNANSYAKKYAVTYATAGKIYEVTVDVSDLAGSYYIQTQADQNLDNGYAGHQIWRIITLE